MASQGIMIRPFMPADMGVCTEVEKAVYGSATFRPIVFRQLYDLSPSLLWVAHDGAKVIGHVCGAISEGGQVGWMLNLAVLAHYRRQGIGERLLRTELDALWKAGAQLIKTTADVQNHSTMKLYEKLGFRRTGTELNYYGDGLDCVIFELHRGE
ncbi:MAG: GNAT family N-acetyltransferase [Chloroflexi bacterium]|nr:GNAT family N-acetyltransferase [Chloroflexota bacterium]